jgi:hypothetical protein
MNGFAVRCTQMHLECKHFPNGPQNGYHNATVTSQSPSAILASLPQLELQMPQYFEAVQKTGTHIIVPYCIERSYARKTSTKSALFLL